MFCADYESDNSREQVRSGINTAVARLYFHGTWRRLVFFQGDLHQARLLREARRRSYVGNAHDDVLPFFLAIGLSALYLHRRAGRPNPGWRLVALASLNGFIGYYVAAYLDFAGLIFITAQLERLVLFTYPVFVMLLGWLFFRGRITMHGLIGAAITYAGLALIFSNGVSVNGWNTVLGTLLVLGAALTFALYQLLAKNLISTLGSTLSSPTP